MSTDLAVIEAALKERRLPEGYTGFALVEPEGSRGAKFVVWCGTQVTAAAWPPAGLTNRETWLTAVPLLGPDEAAEMVGRVKAAEAEVATLREREITGETAGEAMMGAELKRHASRRVAAEAAIERVRAVVERSQTRGGGYSGILSAHEVLNALQQPASAPQTPQQPAPKGITPGARAEHYAAWVRSGGEV